MKKNSFRGRLHFLLGFFNAGKSKWHKSCNKVLRVGFVTPWLNQGHSLKQELFSGRLEFLTLNLSKVLGMKTDEREIDMNKIMKRDSNLGVCYLGLVLKSPSGKNPGLTGITQSRDWLPGTRSFALALIQAVFLKQNIKNALQRLSVLKKMLMTCTRSF